MGVIYSKQHEVIFLSRNLVDKKQQDPDPQNMNVDPPVFLESDHQDGGRATYLAGGQESDPEQSDQAAQAAAAAAATADPPGFSSWPRNDR